MDISSTSTTIATATDINASNQSSSVYSKGDNSFKEEMKEVEKTTQNKEEVSTQKATEEKVEKSPDEKDVTDKKSDEVNRNTEATNKEIDNINKQPEVAKQNTLDFNEFQDKKQSQNEIPNQEQLSMVSMQNIQNTQNFENRIETNETNSDINTHLKTNEIKANITPNLETNDVNSNINTLLEANNQLKNLTQTTQLYGKIDYSDSNMQMSMDDAKFFVDLAQNPDKTLQNVMTEIQQGTEQEVQNVQKHVQVSATLLNNIATAVKTNQPLRIDFDKDVSVILKVDKDGSLSANFIPGDKAVEEYLRQNIATLRQNFDNQQLSYKELSYSRQQQHRENNRRNNKENEHE